MPPLRNAPSGTSLSSRSWTAARNVASISSISCSGSRWSVSNSTTSQYLVRLDAAVCHLQPVAGHELVHVAVNRRGRHQVAERQVPLERSRVDLSFPAGHARQGWQLAGKAKHVADDRVEERLLAQTVARREQLLTTAVVDGEGEHALETVDAGRAELLVGVENDFGVARGPEPMASGLEQRPQRAVVVDLAVEDDPAGLVLVGHRLMPAGAIDDRQPPMTERHPLAVVESVAVRAAMPERIGHAARTASRRVRGQRSFDRERATDAAHSRHHPAVHVPVFAAPCARS